MLQDQTNRKLIEKEKIVKEMQVKLRKFIQTNMMTVPEHFFGEIEDLIDTESYNLNRDSQSSNRKMEGTYRKIREIEEKRKNQSADKEIQLMFEKFTKVRDVVLDQK